MTLMTDDFQKFLRWFGGLTIGGFILIIAFIVLVDPYNLYGVSDIEGINAVKPELSRYIEEIKLTQSVKLNPDTLILGNSRAEIGFDPEAEPFIKRGYNAYNLAIRGTTLASTERQYQYLIQKHITPKRLLIGLDFVDFMNASLTEPTTFIQRSGKKRKNFPVDHWFWRFDSLFSMTSLKDTITTLLIQNDAEAATMTTRGFNPLREYHTIANNEGYGVLFQQRARENAQIYIRKARGKLDTRQFELLRILLENSTDTAEHIILIIYPYHAQILALFEDTGIWPFFLQWKKVLVEEIGQLAKKQVNAKITLIDFSGYGSYQCEPIPAVGDLKSVTQWYWELGHFKKTLGDIVMERSLSLAIPTKQNAQNKSSFGIKLDQTTLKSNEERITREKESCFKAQPNIFKQRY